MKKITISILILTLTLSTSCSQVFKRSKKPQNIILMIGDGMGISQIQAGLTANKGSLNMLQMPVTGLQKTSSSDNYITDSAAGATALSSGNKTKNERIGLDSLGKPVKTILELAEENGLSTGLVSTSSITHATPASFIAHQRSRYFYERIAGDFLKTDIDVFIGGGLQFFNNRKDSVDLTIKLKENGYTVLTDINDVKSFQGEKLAGLVAKEHTPRITEGRGEMLSNATKKAIDILSKNKKGFFLMVEGSQIDWGGHDNDQDYVISELLDFDKVVGEALEFAKQDGNTLVIVTADHETGGLVIKNGNYEKGEVISVFTSEDHTGTMVPVFAYGPGSNSFTGFYENTGIFQRMKELLGL